MARRAKDLTGQRFGLLTVVAREGSGDSGSPVWRCSCDCGGESTPLGSMLKTGRTKSCGCKKTAGISGAHHRDPTKAHAARRTNAERFDGKTVAEWAAEWKCSPQLANYRLRKYGTAGSAQAKAAA